MRARRGRATATRSSAAASSRSPTSGSPSRTARRTRWCSSRVSTPRRRCPARACRSSCVTARRSGPAPRAPTASPSRLQTRLRDPRNWSEFAFLVMAEKDGDVAYAGSDWNDGILPWEFGSNFDLRGSRSAAARHGVHRSRRLQARRRGPFQGDRAQQHAGGRAHACRGDADVTSRCATRATRSIDERTVKANAWSTAEWTLTVPPEGALGNYSVSAILESERPKAPAARGRRSP